MKIGILTFHSQLNYGGVLQCWALKMALLRLLQDGGAWAGKERNEVVVVDRWIDERNFRLRNEFAWIGWKKWMKRWAQILIRGVLGCDDFGKSLRTIRTIRFVNGFGLTKEHFCQWDEIGKTGNSTIEQLDLLVVGSDQVWHAGDWGDPRPYLLEGAPKIRAISYAASFGMKEIPLDMIDLYRRGLARFASISCREQEGVEICKKLNIGAAHTADPTLLVDREEWLRLAGLASQGINQRGRVLVCYFMKVDLISAIPLLEVFAKKMNCMVEVLTNDLPMVRPLPRSVGDFLQNFHCGRVKICRGYGPKEFVRAFASATWTLTDSFHAVMFSSIFDCNARFLRPVNDRRKVMFSRIEEFASKYINGPFFVDDVQCAMVSFERGEKVAYDFVGISAMREASTNWLRSSLNV